MNRLHLRFRISELAKANSDVIYETLLDYFAFAMHFTSDDTLLKQVLPFIPEADIKSVKENFIASFRDVDTHIIVIIVSEGGGNLRLRAFHDSSAELRRYGISFVEILNKINLEYRRKVIDFPTEDSRKVAIKIPKEIKPKESGKIVDSTRRSEATYLKWVQVTLFIVTIIITVILHALSIQNGDWWEHISQHFGRFSTALGAGALLTYIQLKLNSDLQERFSLHWHDK